MFVSSHLLAEIEQVCTARRRHEPTAGWSRRARSPSCAASAAARLRVVTATPDDAPAAAVLTRLGLGAPSCADGRRRRPTLGDAVPERS